MSEITRKPDQPVFAVMCRVCETAIQPKEDCTAIRTKKGAAFETEWECSVCTYEGEHGAVYDDEGEYWAAMANYDRFYC